MPGRGRPLLQAGVDLRQRRAPVDLRLAFAEQVEVGAMQEQESCHREPLQKQSRSLRQVDIAVQFADIHGF